MNTQNDFPINCEVETIKDNKKGVVVKHYKDGNIGVSHDPLVIKLTKLNNEIKEYLEDKSQTIKSPRK